MNQRLTHARIAAGYAARFARTFPAEVMIRATLPPIATAHPLFRGLRWYRGLCAQRVLAHLRAVVR